MPSAQGHITVRRRAKDGTDGSDAVRYWVVPSVTQIKQSPTGSFNPTSVTCKRMKSSGNATPVETTEGTLQYKVSYLNGSTDAVKNYTSAVSVPKNCQSITFVLMINNVEVSSESVSVLADGKGITGVTEFYAKSSSSTVAPSKWTESVPELDSTSKYLWNFERVFYSDGTHVDTTPAVIGVYGKGISSVTNYYLATSSSSGVTTGTSGWTTTVQSPTSTKRYLWNYEVIVYTDNTSKTIDPHIIGVYGETGKGISKVEEFYLASSSSSGVTTSTKGWSTDVPTLSASTKYLWNYEKTTYTNGDVESTPPAIIGVFGNDGKGISSVTNYYLATSSSSGVTTGTSGWTTTVQSPTSTKRYLWNYEKISYTVGDPTYTDPHIIGVYGEKGNDGAPGDKGDKGLQGLQGCVYRRSKFATGFKYHNDSDLKDDGIRYIDLVYIMKDSTMFASHALWFRCKKTHTSNSSNAPQKTNNGTESWLEYWEPLNSIDPVYTPLLLADDAVITLMQSNQILIANDDGVITAGLSGSLSGNKIRIWAGASTPDNAPFRVDSSGALVATKADITGTINASSGKIGGFNISGNGLTNGPDFSNDAYIIFRNDAHGCFAGIGGNILPATTGARGVARFENHDTNDWWALGTNYAMLVSARGVRDNRAIQINGGTISGLAMCTKIVEGTTYTIKSTDYQVICINTSDLTLTLPVMQLYDDGHVIRIKRLGTGAVKIKLDYCYTYNGNTSRFSKPCLSYDQNKTLTGTDTLSLPSICDAIELVWCRDIIRTIDKSTYYGVWLEYKLPRDW